MFLICSYFILFLSSSAHRQPLGGVIQKSGSVKTFSIQTLFFENLYHLNGKSKGNFLNIEVYGGFLLTFILCVF